MIRAAVVGAARLLFNAAVLAFALGALLLYASYRLVRSSVARDEGRPVREAGFEALTALVGLARALKQTAPKVGPDHLPMEKFVDAWDLPGDGEEYDASEMSEAERDSLAARFGL